MLYMLIQHLIRIVFQAEGQLFTKPGARFIGPPGFEEMAQQLMLHMNRKSLYDMHKQLEKSLKAKCNYGKSINGFDQAEWIFPLILRIICFNGTSSIESELVTSKEMKQQLRKNRWFSFKEDEKRETHAHWIKRYIHAIMHPRDKTAIAAITRQE